MMRIVTDTNVIVSALVFGGLPRQVLALCMSKACELCYSGAIREETERILEEKFAWDRQQIAVRTEGLLSSAIQIYPALTLNVIKEDLDDDRILECAVEAKARAIISGDHHLLKLASFQGISIQTPRQFLEAKLWLKEVD
jgi:putative PIN family toxin of toxin-antitoxin system